MSNPPFPPLPLPDDDRITDEGVAEPGVDDMATIEHDGKRVVDPDIDPAQVDSAAADRMASGAPTEEGDL
ncbi:hypothetical protein ACSS7Z_11540 [Microbacterium sp. A82]|uniref:hypothetical protein n=1 Tax=unclassified Microbacterium TaxID=2609290 RepID=UPI003F33A45D